MKANLLSFCQTLHLTEVGIVSLPLAPSGKEILTETNPCPFTVGTPDVRLLGGTKLSHPNSAIVILFPYYVPISAYNISVSSAVSSTDTNIARYTWSTDYHIVVSQYLQTIINHLKQQPGGTDAEYELHCDTTPLADRYMAYLGGLGFYGENRCFINPTYGSYVFIGTIITSLEIPADTPLQTHCLQCMQCQKHCPGQALSGATEGGRTPFHYERCKSFITQKKGNLTNSEIAILRKTPALFGCDVCQEVCPHNKGIPTTPIAEFQNIQPWLNTQDLSAMTNREFKLTHGNRAYAWRGKSILLRNEQIISATEDSF